MSDGPHDAAVAEKAEKATPEPKRWPISRSGAIALGLATERRKNAVDAADRAMQAVMLDIARDAGVPRGVPVQIETTTDGAMAFVAAAPT